MQIGVADFGLNVWSGGCFDIDERLRQVKKAGYDGIERVEALNAADAVEKAGRYRLEGMDFATCRGPEVQASIRWTAAMGKEYVWVSVSGEDFDTFCRQASIQAEASLRWGVQSILHNHMGSLVETQEELEEFLERCPNCGLLLDTAHLAVGGGDAVEIAEKYADRIVAVHLKDWIETTPKEEAETWHDRGRWCVLGRGNIGLDNAAVVEALVDAGFDGWLHVEQDTHAEDPIEELAQSRQYVRDIGF